MNRAMFSGVAGLKTHQTRMDVIGNNIANVNTVGYKSQTALFSDLLYQNSSNATGPNPTTNIGGINAKQVGLGAKMASINTNITLPGSAETTNNPFDIRITGESFLIVNNGSENLFTRDGSFKVDAAGNLVMSSNGYKVMGWQPDPNNAGEIKADTVSALQIMSAANMTYPAEATTAAYVSGIIDSGSPEVAAGKDGKIMNLNFYDARGYSYTAKFAIKTKAAETGDSADLNYFTCDLTEIQRQTADGKTENIIAGVVDTFGGKSYDATKKACSIVLAFNKKDGTIKTVNGEEVKTDDSKPVKLAFKTTGDASSMGIDKDGVAVGISIDFSTLKNLGNEKTSTAGATAGNLEGKNAGRMVGKMSGVSIGTEGKVYATYDNGQSKLLGQIAVARFANPSGLQKEGDNLYKSSQNSGEFDGIGVDVTSDGGKMTPGELEMSNVDLSGELTGMIVTQRGFQANSRIITVSDTMLEELINLKR